METTSFLTWLIGVALVGGIGIGVMVYAYWGAGSVSVLFEQAIALPGTLPDSERGTEATVQFQRGYSAYQQQNYRQAIDDFSRAIQQVPNFAEAYHNLGLTYANLRQDDNSVVNLLKASELYSQQEKEEQILLVKEHLAAIRERKLARQRE